MSSGEESQRPPQNPPTFVMRQTRYSKSGEKTEQLIMDPLGHRLNDPVRSPWVDVHSTHYPGLQGNKALMFGHLSEKERQPMYDNADAYVALCDLGMKVSGGERLARAWFAGRIEARAEVSMGIGGAAISSENTKTTKTISREEKPSRWSLRR
jgi:hypothetical protein